MLGDGTFRLSSGTVNLNGTWNHAGPVRVDSGTLNVNVDATLASLTAGPSGTLGGAGRATIAGATVMDGLQLIGTGEKVTEGLLTITGSTDNNRLNGATLRVLGSAVWDASRRILFAENARIINEAGSTFEVRNDQKMEQWFGALSTFENHGTFTKAVGNGTSEIQLDLVNDGALEAAAGILAFTRSYVQASGETRVANAILAVPQGLNLRGGRLAGDGTVAGAVGSRGELDPGGILTVAGDYLMESNHTYLAEIQGTIPGNGHDQVAVNGTVHLAGTLKLDFGGFAPAVDDTFTIMTWSGFAGSFAATNLTTRSDVEADVQATSTGLVVRVTSVGEESDELPRPGFTHLQPHEALAARQETTQAGADGEAVTPVSLHWETEPGRLFRIEVSVDLHTWHEVAAVVTEVAPGSYRATVIVPEVQGPRMFRYLEVKE